MDKVRLECTETMSSYRAARCILRENILGASEITANLYCKCVSVLGRLRDLQHIFAVIYRTIYHRIRVADPAGSGCFGQIRIPVFEIKSNQDPIFKIFNQTFLAGFVRIRYNTELIDINYIDFYVEAKVKGE